MAHLLAISGLHISYIVLAIVFILSKLQVNKRIANSITIVFLIFFMCITNFTESIVRAGIMGIILLGAQILFKKPDAATSIGLSLIIILVENPYKLFSIGFQLSYAGTIGIIYLYPKLKGKLNDIFAVCISAQIFVAPIMLIHFNTFSTYFLLANILASPLAGAVIILGFAFVLVSFIWLKLSMVLYLPLKLLLNLLILINQFISSLPFSSIMVKTPYLFNVFFYYIAVILLFKQKKFQVWKYTITIKKLLCISLIILAIITIILDIPKDFVIHLVDVGQGDCTLIRTTSNKTILIDGGGNENYDIGKNVLVPYLLDRRITTIDYIMISHFDSDHCLGLFEVIEKFSVKNVITSKQYDDSANYQKFLKISKDKNVIYVNAGDVIRIDNDVQISILWPVEDYVRDDVLNNNSIVARLKYRDTSILFTGDIEKKAEARIVSMYGDKLKSDILKVGHHGSKTSSTANFVKAVKPKIALIGVGENNTFGHPSKQVIERLQNNGVKVFRTDQYGEISITVWLSMGTGLFDIEK